MLKDAKEGKFNEVLEIIQNYVEGEYIYIPKKEENKIAWGELTQSKEELLIRNDKIYCDYLSGVSVQILSERYSLSPKTIQRIILQKEDEKLNASSFN